MWIVDLLLVLPSFLIIAILSPRSRQVVAGPRRAADRRVPVDGHRADRARHDDLAARARVRAGRALHGRARPHRIIFRHIIPNISSLLIIDATINVSAAIIAETGLSYFGFGVQPPDVSLGTLIADGTTAATTYPWLFVFAGGAAGPHRPRGEPRRRRPARRARPDVGSAREQTPSRSLVRARPASVTFPGGARPTSRPCAASTTSSRAARCSGIVGRVRLAASRRRRSRSWGCCPDGARVDGLGPARRPGADRPRRRAALGACAASASRWSSRIRSRR